MNTSTIFQPVFAMMLLTMIVWFYLYTIRIAAMKKARVRVQTYTTPEKVAEHLPEAANYPANNLKNLFEVPVLYYVLCVMLYLLELVDTTLVFAAWVFFVFRTLHSIVHCTRNIVMWRFYYYAASSLTLWFMLGWALYKFLRVY